jgi:hypothetical protein
MEPRLALIAAGALLAATLTPVPSYAEDASTEGISRYATLVRDAGMDTLVYGVPVTPPGLAGGAEAGGDDGLTDESDSSAPYGGADGDGYQSPDTSNTTTKTGSKGVSARTLLEIIIGIIFGQDRPWDEKRG